MCSARDIKHAICQSFSHAVSTARCYAESGSVRCLGKHSELRTYGRWSRGRTSKFVRTFLRPLRSPMRPTAALSLSTGDNQRVTPFRMKNAGRSFSRASTDFTFILVLCLTKNRYIFDYHRNNILIVLFVPNTFVSPLPCCSLLKVAAGGDVHRAELASEILLPQVAHQV